MYLNNKELLALPLKMTPTKRQHPSSPPRHGASLGRQNPASLQQPAVHIAKV